MACYGTIIDAIFDELESAHKKHPVPIHSVVEGYGVILEELDEFWDEVKKKPKKRCKDRLAEELIQVAAMAMRTLKDCDLEESLPSPNNEPEGGGA